MVFTTCSRNSVIKVFQIYKNTVYSGIICFAMTEETLFLVLSGNNPLSFEKDIYGLLATSCKLNEIFSVLRALSLLMERQLIF